jgi:hypothetical protein
MSKTQGTYFGEFLRDEIEKWAAADPDGRTNRRLAKESGITEQQIGQIRNFGIKADANTALKLWKPLGFSSFDELNEAVEKYWAASGRSRPKPKGSEREEQQLRDRDEWVGVVAEARLDRPEITDERAWEMAGDTLDSEQFPRPLNAKLIGNLAYMWLVQIRLSDKEQS